MLKTILLLVIALCSPAQSIGHFKGSFFPEATMFFGANYTSGTGSVPTMVDFPSTWNPCTSTSCCVLPNTSSGTCTITLPHSTSSGDTLVVAQIVGNSGIPSPFATDASNTYSTQWNSLQLDSKASRVALNYVLSSAAGISSITCTEPAGGGAGGCFAWHISGLGNHLVDTDNTANITAAGGASPWASGNINTAIANEVIIGVEAGFFNGANCNSTVTSWSALQIPSSGAWDGGNGGEGVVGHRVVSSTQTGLNFGGTDSGTCTHNAGIIAFK